MTDDERDAVLKAIDLYAEMHRYDLGSIETLQDLRSARAQLAADATIDEQGDPPQLSFLERFVALDPGVPRKRGQSAVDALCEAFDNVRAQAQSAVSFVEDAAHFAPGRFGKLARDWLVEHDIWSETVEDGERPDPVHTAAEGILELANSALSGAKPGYGATIDARSVIARLGPALGVLDRGAAHNATASSVENLAHATEAKRAQIAQPHPIQQPSSRPAPSAVPWPASSAAPHVGRGGR